jgi:hypothetical protein
MDWSWGAWIVSASAVVLSGAIAWAEGNWARRPGLAMGFTDHGGMWSDLVLLSMANAVIVPHLSIGPWLLWALAASTGASLWVHRHWYTPRQRDDDGTSAALPPAGHTVAAPEKSHASHGGDHIWPNRTRGSWWRDLSWSGWAHVGYVIAELTLLAGFLVHPIPAAVVILITVIFTIHVPIGLLQPRWFRTGHIATVQEQPLLAPLLLALWTVTYVKL